MFDLLFSLGWGGISLTREKANNLVENLVKSGDIKKEDANKVFNELIERGEKEREEFREYLGKEMNKMMERYNIVTRREVEELKDRINNLEEKLSKINETEEDQ